MKLKNLLLLLFLILILSVSLTYLYYNNYIIEKTEIMDIELKVGETIGLNADTDALKFGKLMPETSGLRKIKISNTKNYPLKITLVPSGEISGWIHIPQNNFLLEKKENKSILIEAKIPKSAKLGNYTGKLKIIFKKTIIPLK